MENIKNAVYLGNGKNIKENKLENSSPNNNFSPIEDKTQNRDSINRITCSLCDLLKSTTTSNVIRLDCGHDFCQNCLNLIISQKSKVSQDYFVIMQCPYQFCKSILDINKVKPFLDVKLIRLLELIKKNISNDQWISDKPINIKQMKSKEEKIDNFQGSKLIECGKCKIKIAVYDIITLNCEHKFCKHCMKEEWEKQIKLRHDLKCLKCSNEIDFPIIEANLSMDFAEKYDKYLLEKVIYAPTPRNYNRFQFENIVFCPKCNKNPLKKTLHSKYDDYCSSCNEFFCQNCFGSSKIHSGRTCEEYQQIVKMDVHCLKCKNLIAFSKTDFFYVFCSNCSARLCSKCKNKYSFVNYECSF